MSRDQAMLLLMLQRTRMELLLQQKQADGSFQVLVNGLRLYLTLVALQQQALNSMVGMEQQKI
jgi:hypothetical protein